MPANLVVHSSSADETKRIGFRLGRLLTPGDAVLLMATLGAGKTTFVQGLVKGLGVREEALSPTFVLAQSFEGKYPVHHLDFYRVTKQELLDIGIQDYFTGASEIPKGVVLVEWADRCKAVWPKSRLEVRIRIPMKSTERVISLTAKGERFDLVLGRLRMVMRAI